MSANTVHSEKELKHIVMSGMRPTGKLHLGHYFGVIKNWLTLQDQYPCFFSVADWHALTTGYAKSNTSKLKEHKIDMVLDWLAAGLDPEKATIFLQSDVPEIAEMHLLFSMLTPAKWVQTDPTLKDMVAMLSDDLSYGLLGYPVLQTVDILSVQATLVPVGKDQLAHLEISRDLARRFNHTYQSDLFVEPQPLLTDIPLMMGLDGRKMGKSYGNAIYLSDSEDETRNKIKTAVTDTNRVKRSDPGNPDNCQVVYSYYPIFGSPSITETVGTECRSASRGCMDCKKQLTELVNESLAALRKQRQELQSNPQYVEKILEHGQQQARDVCQKTLYKMKQAMSLI